MKLEKVNIHESWKAILKDEFQESYFAEIKENILKDKQEGITVYPEGKLIFNAYNTTPFDKVKVVIIGQDPYHNPGEAMGLSFSVPMGIRIPPSLRNIYKELHSDIDFEIPDHGDLTHWAEQGVLLLNAFLTVQHKKAGSHRKIGWNKFTDATIKAISERGEHIVFMLWGNFAKAKEELIDGDRHLILKAAHPSPLARGAYFGSKHFSQANTYLNRHKMGSINWNLM